MQTVKSAHSVGDGNEHERKYFTETVHVRPEVTLGDEVLRIDGVSALYVPLF